MRTKTWLAFIISMALVVLLGATQKDTQKDQSAEAKLQAAIIKETVEGDLKGAIEQYENIIALTGAGRATVATALLRLGGCYEKMGLEGVRKAYERLVRDFADQSEQVQAARSRLVALGNPAAEERDTDFMTRLIWTSADGVFTHAPSPDGKSMSYTDWESGNLAVHNLEAGTSRVLTDEGTWEQPVQHALSSRWSPDGKKLAYYWYHGSGTQLRILNVDNPKPQVLFEDVSDDADVFPHDWSPDGQHILVSISRTGREELALLPVDGGSPRMLWTFEPGIDLGEIRFSPDGRYVVYSRRSGEVAASDIFILDLNESEEIPLIRHPADDYVFGWSPDGNWILFASDRTGTIGLWAIRVDDGKPQGIPISVKPSAGRIAPLGFAEDGSFYYADVKVARDVYGARIDFDTGTVLAEPTKVIKRYEGSNMNPRYSPDGKSLAYVSRRGSMVFPTNRANALCIHSLESGSERVFMDEFVSHGVRAIAGPRWSPDSRSIAVAGHRTGGILNALYLVDLDTGKVTTLLEASPNVRIRGHEFSQDGRQLFYLRRDTKEEVSRILALDLQNGEERELYQTSGINFPWGIAASPDGKWLATMTYPLALSLIPSGGGAPHIIHRFDQLDRILNPEWLPDGKAILVGGRGSYTEARGISLYRVPLEGGEIQEIVLQQRLGDRPTIHPDGQRIAFGYQSNHDSDADVWIMQNFLPEVEDTRKRLAGLQGSR